MNQYVALLRGINVGGNNLIKMPALRACFEALGFGNVATKPSQAHRHHAGLPAHDDSQLEHDTQLFELMQRVSAAG